ncbi:DUF7673 family protein [Billgrantia gudaonensis]|uniref:DUF7673 domain-containing protein n=1 Tax=Billgrantia gudaonensis TaxID=376427 RepID=A0A1G8XF58_9GAMM|nr:hypothetical protein [Halomonas gudaonensis]SDJ89101.1 hypothetical protein SAMN04487954_10921 [Halomonas gudaonensis]
MTMPNLTQRLNERSQQETTMADRPLTTDLTGRPIPGQQDVVYIDLDAERAKHIARQAELLAHGMPALQRLAEVAHRHTHQAQHCRRILLAVYNGAEWPLDLTRLRVLDEDLQRAAFAVIEWSADCDRELHEYLDDGNRLLQRFWNIEKGED